MLLREGTKRGGVFTWAFGTVIYTKKKRYGNYLQNSGKIQKGLLFKGKSNRVSNWSILGLEKGMWVSIYLTGILRKKRGE